MFRQKENPMPLDKIFRCAGLLVMAFFSASIFAGDARLPLPGGRMLVLPAPDGWRYAQRSGRAPTLEFLPQNGAQFSVLVSTSPESAIGPATPAAARNLVEISAAAALPQAVEPTLPIEEIRADGIQGYYFSATDKAPKSGEFKYMTQGVLMVQEQPVVFTIFSHNDPRAAVEPALRMLGAARLETGAPQAAPQDAVSVYLVPLADFPEELAAALAVVMSRDMGLRVKASMRLPPLAVATRPGSDQLIADEILAQGASASARIPDMAPHTYRVFLTARDINGRSGNFRFQFSTHAPALRSSVVSMARLFDAVDNRPALTEASFDRLYKLVTRAIGEHHFGWQRSSDPGDVMYAPLMSVNELDRMGTSHAEAPVIERAQRLMQWLAQGKFRESAEEFHYPPEYSQAELDNDKNLVAHSLTRLAEEIGGIENLRRQPPPSSQMLTFGFGGGSPAYWDAHPELVRAMAVDYEATAGRDGAVYFHVSYVQSDSQWQVRAIEFRLPAAQPDAAKRIVEIASRIQPGSTTAARSDEILDTTVCDLVANPRYFNGRLVKIRAHYESDGIGLRLLTDPRCPGGIVPSGQDSPAVGGDLLAALRRGCAATTDKQVTATWSGQFHWEPENQPGTGKAPRWVDVQKIEDLEVKPLPGGPTCL
jgi:predicted Zn-dependent protease